MGWTLSIPFFNCYYIRINKGVAMSKKLKFKPRNPMIVAAFAREISLVTKVEQNKKKYNRKEKHRKDLEC
jgi:hypothetical protein